MPGAGLYLKALRTLAGDRPVSIGFGAILTGHIPYPSLIAFAARYGIDHVNDFDDFCDVVRTLDDSEVSRINTAANQK